MFTGIIDQIGRIESLTVQTDGQSYQIQVRHAYQDPFALGESIAVMGTCLTVTDIQNDLFSADISPTTAEITTLSQRHTGDAVNLERPLTLNSRLGGHLVQGHVDERGQVSAIVQHGDSREITFTSSAAQGLVVEKGSIAVDGVSLTVVQLAPDGFQVTLIPHTLSLTTLGQLQEGSLVNLEYDLMAKYVQRLATPYLGALEFAKSLGAAARF